MTETKDTHKFKTFSIELSIIWIYNAYLNRNFYTRCSLVINNATTFRIDL